MALTLYFMFLAWFFTSVVWKNILDRKVRDEREWWMKRTKPLGSKETQGIVTFQFIGEPNDPTT